MQNANELPDWVRKKPEKFAPRLSLEIENVRKAFPFFGFYVDGTKLFVEGPMVTRSGNAYTIRAYYPENYPYSHPIPIVMDHDVRTQCQSGTFHTRHWLGVDECGGVRLCVIKASDEVGCGWTPDMSMLTILNLSAAWLHAHEVQIATGKWILPQAWTNRKEFRMSQHVPFTLDLSQFGGPGNRRNVNVADTTAAIEPFTKGQSELGFSPLGQVSNAASVEMRDISPEKRNLLASMVRSY